MRWFIYLQPVIAGVTHYASAFHSYKDGLAFLHKRVHLVLPTIAVCLIALGQANAQFTQQGGKLVGTGGVNSEQGSSVSLSSDGNTAVVGGDGDNLGGIWIWTRSGGVWSQQGTELVGTGTVGNSHQGNSVSLSSDGNTAIVGGSTDNSSVGAVWVWTRSGGVWSQQGTKLVGTGAVGSPNQGYSVSLSADGNTAIVGGHNDNSGAGAAWVWTRSAGVWTQQGSKLVGTGAVGPAHQGISVSISSDGNTAIVSGYNDNSGVGAVWVWTRSGGVWSQQGTKLVGTGAIGNTTQGFSVSLSSDGNTAIISGYLDNSAVGAVWVWTLSGGIWTQQGTKLVGTGGAGIPYQGYSVSLSGDGNTAIVGGVGDSIGVGAVWVWTRSGGVWSQQGTKFVGTGAVGKANQGVSVSLSSDGYTAIVGGWQDNSLAGAAWIYATPDAPLPVEVTSFSAKSERLNAALQWNTATEVNSDGFDVERKTIDTWINIGFVDGAGTSNSPKEYSYTDKNLLAGTYSYRLKQIDRDGTFKYSQEVEVEVTGAPTEFSLSQNYPNPFNPTTNLQFTIGNSQFVELRVFDLLGREVTTLVNEARPAGSYSVKWDATNLPSGTYIYRLKAGSFTETKKMILMK